MQMTITASSLVAKSSRSYGQLKPPSVAGPGLCWYSFVPDSGQRVELQIYRLISVGKFNGTDCLGGQVILSDVFNSSTTICGTNERFTPPVVLFVDRGSSRLTFQIQDSTTRSQFLAYFSFTPLNSSHPGVGFQPRGGQRVNNTGSSLPTITRGFFAAKVSWNQVHYTLRPDRSGSSIPPYDYNGFVASIRFTGITSTDTSIATARTSGGGGKPSCEMIFFANMSRSGHFDSRSFQGHWSINCTLIFIGLETDVVHISLFNYVLKAPSCHTFIEFYDASKPIRKICSPSQKNINDQKQHRQGGSNQQPLFTSTHSRMKISLIRAVHLVKENQDEEFIDGAYSFHDQRIYGTLQPDTLCNGNTICFWNIDHRLICSSRFIPRTNQSVVLSITSLGKLSSGDTSCHTACGDTGCFCNPAPLTSHSEEGEALASLDHLKLINDDGEVVACLCGEFQQDWLPVSVRSWSPISLVYSVAHYTYTAQGFTHETKYEFIDDNLCGHHTLEQYSGLIQSSQSVQRSQDLNYYYNLQCTWLLNSKVKRSVYIEFYSEQNKPCASWNLTVTRYKPSAPDRCGRVLHVFCPRDQVKLFNTNESVVILKLTAHTTLIPQYSVKYYSKLRDEMSDTERAVNEGVIGLTSHQGAGDEVVQDMTSSVQDEPHPELPSSVLASRNVATSFQTHFQWVLIMGTVLVVLNGS
ncbi:hypothetical protein WDU94_000269 [Cyamophila willieti]